MAAGAFSGKVAKMAKLGTGNGLLQISLPVEPRLLFYIIKYLK